MDPQVVDGPHTIWADVGGGNGRKDVAAVAQLAPTALSYKISEGRGYIDPNGKYHHDQAVAHGMFPIPYTFPLPASCGMSLTDQARRDADLIHSHHGSFTNIGLMVDLEYEPGAPGWGPFLINSSDVALYIRTFKQITGMKVGGYTGAGYVSSGSEGFDWRVIPRYSYSGSPQGLDVILRQLNGGVTWMPPAPAFRQFTDAVNISGSATDFNIAPISPAEFLAVVGYQEDEMTPADWDKLTQIVRQAVSDGVKYELTALLGTPPAGQKPTSLNQVEADVTAIKKKLGA